MGRVTIEELERELNATDEAYVRRKLLTKRFAANQEKHVQAWLALRDMKRSEQRLAQELAISKRTVFWAKFAALGTLFGAVVALVTFLIPRVA